MGGSGVQAPPLLCREFEASTGYVKQQTISLNDCFRNEVCGVSFMLGTSPSTAFSLQQLKAATLSLSY